MLQIAHEARLQEIKEIYNDFLVKGKTKIRKEQAEFFQMQFETLVTNISTKSQSFGERINDAYLKLHNIKVEALRKRQELLIESIIGDYYETVDKLVKNFRKILLEGFETFPQFCGVNFHVTVEIQNNPWKGLKLSSQRRYYLLLR